MYADGKTVSIEGIDFDNEWIDEMLTLPQPVLL
jgi:hypothetical protein